MESRSDVAEHRWSRPSAEGGDSETACIFGGVHTRAFTFAGISVHVRRNRCSTSSETGVQLRPESVCAGTADRFAPERVIDFNGMPHAADDVTGLGAAGVAAARDEHPLLVRSPNSRHGASSHPRWGWRPAGRPGSTLASACFVDGLQRFRDLTGDAQGLLDRKPGAGHPSGFRLPASVVRRSINSAGVGPSTSSRTSALTPSDSSSP